MLLPGRQRVDPLADEGDARLIERANTLACGGRPYNADPAGDKSA